MMTRNTRPAVAVGSMPKTAFQEWPQAYITGVNASSRHLSVIPGVRRSLVFRLSGGRTAPLHPGRFTAHIEGDFVVFLIGMRVTRLLLAHKWLPVARAMPPMIKELMKQPELGFLHGQVCISG